MHKVLNTFSIKAQDSDTKIHSGFTRNGESHLHHSENTGSHFPLHNSLSPCNILPPHFMQLSGDMFIVNVSRWTCPFASVTPHP